MGAPVVDLPPPGSGSFVGASGGVGVGVGGCASSSIGAGFHASIKSPIPCLPFKFDFSLFFTFSLPAFAFAIQFFVNFATFIVKFSLNCSGFNIAAGVTLPAGGGRVSACVPDLDDFELAA
ncbi:MAG TPA: hypothetical protein VN864_01115 [Thermoplasmata archaeon]|nr:hypothetical protein [Thermoplasmata archaeon]